MPARYGTRGTQSSTIASPGKTAQTLIGVATRRAFLYDFIVSYGATPADVTMETIVARFSAAGTTTASPPAPFAVDVADPAALFTTGWNLTAEPTYTTDTRFFDQFIHQRATFRWVCAPSGEVAMAASTTAGVGFYAIHASATPLQQITAHWFE
jgi:hypothetical protein